MDWAGLDTAMSLEEDRMSEDRVHKIFIWIRIWEDTFTATGCTKEDCHKWLAQRLVRWGITDFRQFLTL